METHAAQPDSSTHDEAQRSSSWWRRIAWLVAIWALSVAALGAVAYLFRFIMGWAGLTR